MEDISSDEPTDSENDPLIRLTVESDIDDDWVLAEDCAWDSLPFMVLPSEIWALVLLEQPAEDLHLLIPVCKTWTQIVTSKSFLQFKKPQLEESHQMLFLGAPRKDWIASPNQWQKRKTATIDSSTKMFRIQIADADHVELSKLFVEFLEDNWYAQSTSHLNLQVTSAEFPIFFRGVYHLIGFTFTSQPSWASYFASKGNTDLSKFSQNLATLQHTSLQEATQTARKQRGPNSFAEPWYIRICDKEEGKPEIELGTHFFQSDDNTNENIPVESIKMITLNWYNKQDDKFEASSSQDFLTNLFGGPLYEKYDAIYHERLIKIQNSTAEQIFVFLYSLIIAIFVSPFVGLADILLIFFAAARYWNILGVLFVVPFLPLLWPVLFFFSIWLLSDRISRFGIGNAFAHTWEEYCNFYESCGPS